MRLATRPVSTVEGTFTGNQYTVDLYPGNDNCSPDSSMAVVDCNSKSVSFNSLTGLFWAEIVKEAKQRIKFNIRNLAKHLMFIFFGA
jgi:hypothetical protein